MRTQGKILSCLIVLFIATISLQAQAHRKIVIDSALVDEDNNTQLGSIDTIYIRLHLTDSADNFVAGVGNIRYWVQSDSMDQLSIAPKCIDNVSSTEFIPAAGRFDTLYLPLDSLILRTGPVNVIIIWPSMVNPANPLLDSGFAIIHEYVIPDVGYEDQNMVFGSTVYPNPSASIQLIRINSHYSQLIDHITILDGLGKLWMRKDPTQGEENNGYMINTEGLENGVYYIQIHYKDHKVEVVKFVKN